jgi:hypothetical protein
MSEISEIRQKLQKEIGDSFSQVSSGFMEVSAKLKMAGIAEEFIKSLDHLFKTWLRTSQVLSGDVNALTDRYEEMESKLKHLNE